MSDFINEHEIKKAIAMLKPNGQLFEVRVLQGKKILSGYFKSAESLIEAFKRISLRDSNVYLSLNCINGACWSRQQCEHFVQNPLTTNDNDVTGYQWMLVDLDPERPTGVSSTAEELTYAKEMATKVHDYLKNLGFEEPVGALSGNGYHLLYAINLANTAENVELVRRCLEVLSEMFSNEFVKVDTVNYNPSRICKLHGTLAQKGFNTEERPHRMSRIFTSSMDVKPTGKVFLQKLAGELPKAPPPPKQKTYSADGFDLRRFLNEHGVRYKESIGAGRDNSTIFALDECPFDSNHKNGDSKIFLYPSGEISFRCHHNSCSGKKWQDVRKLLDPSAYEHNDFDDKYDEGMKKQNRFKQSAPVMEFKAERVFRTLAMIEDDDEPEFEYIRSGITEIDKELNGLQKQAVSMISGLRGCGKSTLLGTIILQAVNDGNTVVAYSGELSNRKYANWLYRQAAGSQNLQVSTEHKNGVGVPDDVRKKIMNWCGDKLWIYDNRFGSNFKQISRNIRTVIADTKADLVIIDNLMILDLSEYGSQHNHHEYEAQTEFVKELKNIAEQTNTHIIFVAHPKKVTGLIRLDDVSGTGNITNIVDNAFLVHRNNLDFQKRFAETFRAKPSDMNIDDKATNIIEIAKDRENGTMDYFVSLYFEAESKRIRNSLDEYIHYGWEYEGFRLIESDEVLPFDN